MFWRFSNGKKKEINKKRSDDIKSLEDSPSHPWALLVGIVEPFKNI
jgi:hypothetical protein